VTPDQIQDLSAPLLQQGILGVSTVFLGYFCWFFYRSREIERKEHKLELAALHKRIDELHEKRISEKDAITTMALSHNRTIDELSRSLNMRMPA